MEKKYVIGIDSGTQSTRAILFDLKGRKLFSATAGHPGLILGGQNQAEHDFNDLYNGLCQACQELMAQFHGKPEEIAAIGLTAQRGTTIFLDKHNRQVCRPVSWMDGRWKENEPVTQKWKDKVDPWQYYLMNYSRMHWLRKNNPEGADAVKKYLTPTGYLSYRLVGQHMDTLSNNLGMPIDREHWCLYEEDELYEGMGLTRDQLASFVLPGTIMGTVTRKAAEKTGLPPGCPVAAGAGDKQCEVLGSGTLSKGQAYITLGTMTGLNIVDNVYIEDAYQKMKHRTYTAAVPGCWHGEAVSSRGFWLVSWFRDNLAQGLLPEPGQSLEELLDSEAVDIPPGSEGLITIPDWKTTWDKPYARGTYMGFDIRHKRPHMFRSLIEGIILQLKLSTEEMCAVTGRQISEIRVGGGGSKSQVALQAIADIFGIPVKKSQEAETCSLGAAICAAVGAECFGSYAEACEAMGQNYTSYVPNPESHTLYMALMDEVVGPYYAVNEQLLKNLADITKKNDWRAK
ncbi:MAG: FGGY family carbohydrate kinase [Eubacterium sp.]